jgi:hypothetical protein
LICENLLRAFRQFWWWLGKPPTPGLFRDAVVMFLVAVAGNAAVAESFHSGWTSQPRWGFRRQSVACASCGAGVVAVGKTELPQLRQLKGEN